MEAMQLNTPRLKTNTRAYFSRFGRWIPRRVRIGRARIQISVTMLNEEVTMKLSAKLQDVHYRHLQ